MLEKTFSQQAARVFEIVGYLLLIPATVLWLISFLLVLGVLGSLSLENFHYQIFDNLLPLLIPSFIYSLGILLLVGYFKHSRGNLNENRIISLWLGTFFYNLPPLWAVIYQIIIMPKDFNNLDFQELSSPYTLFGLSLVLWWIIAVVLSIGAIYSGLTAYKKYR